MIVLSMQRTCQKKVLTIPIVLLLCFVMTFFNFSTLIFLIDSFSLQFADLMVWVNENYRTYAYRHIYGLISLTLNSSSIMHLTGSTKKFKEAVAVIDVLYGTDKEKDIIIGLEKEKEKEKEDGSSNSLSNMFIKQVSFPRPISIERVRSNTEDVPTWGAVLDKEKDKDKDKDTKKLSSRIAHHFGMSNTGGG